MRNNQEVRLNVTRAFNILRGLFKGALSHRNFGRMFDWFYPQHFGIIQKCMAAYIEEDEIVYLILKFLSDLLDNSSNRLKFDTWNVNGLIIFKESCNLMTQYMQFYQCLAQTSKIVRKDAHTEVYKFLKVLMNMLRKCISGNFINFAICDFYNDGSFTEMSKLVFKCIFNQNLKDILLYEKITKALYKFIEEFFKKNM